jgi:SAM-dependent methyltransferase
MTHATHATNTAHTTNATTTYSETGLAASIRRLAGRDLAELTQQEWDRLDQYHAGGSEAVERLLPGLRLAPGMTVLDVGSGLGGPARQIARGTGCTVIGVDLTPAYVEAAQELTYAAGLAERARFFCTDVGTFDGAEFDAAYTMHVQMNVKDKEAFFTGIAQRLRPGARFATFEVCLNAGASGPRPQPPLPLPWSLDGTDSFLATPDDLRSTICSSGFELLEWTDESAWTNQWFEAVGAEIMAGNAQAALPALLSDGPTRMLNFAIALAEGTLSIHRGSFAARAQT